MNAGVSYFSVYVLFFGLRLRQLADINPAFCLRVMEQLVTGQLDSTVAASACRKDGFKPFHGFVTEDPHLWIFNGKCTYAADGMSCEFHHFFRSQHSGLLTEECLELLIVNLCVTCSLNQNAAVFMVMKRQCFTDSGAFHTYSLSAQEDQTT